jgi:hypothetical protein
MKRLLFTVLVLTSGTVSADIIDTIVADGYYKSSSCINYVSDFSVDDQVTLSASGKTLTMDSAIRYVSSRNSIVKDFIMEIEAEGLTFNEKLEKGKLTLYGQPDMSEAYTGHGYSKPNVATALSNLNSITKDKNASKERVGAADRYILCQTMEMAAGRGPYKDYVDDYVKFVIEHPSKAQVGYFEVATGKSQYGNTVGTGNRLAEPKQWEGSRFFIVNASFKNLDTESRLPVEGSLYITYNGKEYEFDSVETVMAEGYNIWFKKVNPLITMKTKIVYRIPDEIEGDVFWKPGRNPDDTRLWVGSVKAQQ